jgi:hypothetical protein
MPKIYRTMFDHLGHPRVDTGFCELGVRPPGRTRADGRPALSDVDVDAYGNVVLNDKGMSVFRSLSDLPRLPSRLVPLHLAGKVRGAAGPVGTRIWMMGSGSFSSGPLTSGLELFETGGVHGTVCPSMPMPLGTLQNVLAATQNAWTIDEP